MSRRALGFTLAGLALALFLAALSPLASRLPDGLDHTAEKHGIAAPESASEASRPFGAPMPDYWEKEGAPRKILAGIAGTLLVFAATILLAEAMRRRAPGVKES